jgi:transcriptional regulator with XRE-family HTH domain
MTTVKHPGTPETRDSAPVSREPLVGLREDIAAARTQAGRLLACLRHAAGLSQVQLAGRIGYSATAVAHAERGRRPVSAQFWELADAALTAGGRLAAWGSRIQGLTVARREEQRRLDKTRHMRLSGLIPQPGAHAITAVLPAAPATTLASAGTCPHCHQLVTLVTYVAAP